MKSRLDQIEFRLQFFWKTPCSLFLTSRNKFSPAFGAGFENSRYKPGWQNCPGQFYTISATQSSSMIGSLIQFFTGLSRALFDSAQE